MRTLEDLRGLLLFASSIGALEIVRYMLKEFHGEHNATGESTVQELAHELRDLFSEVTVSSPGKVLIAGGYLILEKENLGITVAGSSRFYATVRKLGNGKSAQDILRILVKSPQFHESYTYGYNVATDEISQISGDNVFVAKCLQLVFSFMREKLGVDVFSGQLQHLASLAEGIEIVLQADNDFYSQLQPLKERSWPISAVSLRKLPKFLECPKGEDGKVSVAKTGLGSSATLTTSLVAALLRFFGLVQLSETTSSSSSKKLLKSPSKGTAASLESNASSNWTEDLRIIHNLAQLVHCKAQGKIGSGFDVASAVYGTQVYQRFSPEPFATILEDAKIDPVMLVSAVEDTDRVLWDQVVQPFRLPKGLTLLLGDVCGGSNSPAMARAVLDWKKRSPEDAVRVWKSLAGANRALLSAFQRLLHLEQTDSLAFAEALTELSSHVFASEKPGLSTGSSDTGDMLCLVQDALYDTRIAVSQARDLMRYMGQASGTQIEPAAQKELCDFTMSLGGVVAAAVPGAGGHDAIFALVVDTRPSTDKTGLNLTTNHVYSPVKAVEECWAHWAESGPGRAVVCPLLLRPSGAVCRGDKSSNNNNISGVRAEL